jgi:predicted GIY-YIG superfamily endonuclease
VSPKLQRSAGRLYPCGTFNFLELRNGDIYIGSTNDLRRRFASHQQGCVDTKQYLPAVLRSYVAVADEVTARSLERYFKSGSGKAFAKKRFLGA